MNAGTRQSEKAVKKFLWVFLAAFLVVGCGGGGTGGRSVVVPRAVMPPEPPPEIEPPTYTSFNPPAPTFDFGVLSHVGIGSGDTDDLVFTGTKNRARIYEGRVADGEQANDVIAYLRQTVSGAGALTTFSNPPTVRVVNGADEESVTNTIHAVRIVNSILPYDRQVMMDSSSYAPAPGGAANVPQGNIYIEFAPQREWSKSLSDSSLGYAETYYLESNRRGYASHILIDTGEDLTGRGFVHAIVHELIHSLGFLGHTNAGRFPRSIMNARYIGDLVPLLLTEIDKDAVLAAYTRFSPGTPESEITTGHLGHWESSSAHMIGKMEITDGVNAVFGVTKRNGMVYPFAYGPKPPGPLSESATWTGTLLGFTSSGRKIDGDTRLEVQLAGLAGEFQFSNIKYRDNATWGDGGLAYSVRIQGNNFSNWGQRSNDAGDVSGSFFGRNHEGMGGVLRRQDMTGAFGGTR